MNEIARVAFNCSAPPSLLFFKERAGAVASVTSVVPRGEGRDALSFLVEEDPSVIVAALERAHRDQGRTNDDRRGLLFCL